MGKPRRSWSFLSNDALVLINVVEHPRSTLRNIAGSAGMSERATLSILRVLEADAIISRRREGRRNIYTVDLNALRTHRGRGPYTLEELANALFLLSGSPPGQTLPAPMRGPPRRQPTEVSRPSKGGKRSPAPTFRRKGSAAKTARKTKRRGR